MHILPLGKSVNDDTCGHMRATLVLEKPYSKIYPVINAVNRDGSVLCKINLNVLADVGG